MLPAHQQIISPELSTHLQRGFRLGAFRVLPLQGDVVGPRGSRHLPPKVMSVLLCLAERAGEVVTTHEIVEQVWGGDEAAGRRSLVRCIRELRDAFGDSRDDPQYIATVSRVGYRLIPPVVLSSGEMPVTDLHAPTEKEAESDEGLLYEPVLRLFRELKRRKVIRVAVTYLVIAWAVIEVAATVLPALNLPEWTVTLTVVLAMMGFPIVIILSWLFEVTPLGIVRDRGGLEAEPVSRRQRIVDISILGTVALLVGFLGYRMMPGTDLMLGPTSPSRPGIGEIPITRNSIAVLPFLTLGGDPESAYFGDGLAEEILNLLAKLDELTVASRSSSFYYKGKTIDMRTVSSRLRVRYVLEGSVRRAGNKIRVVARLTDAERNKLEWSDTFDTKLDDVFAIQEEIAEAVVAAAQTALSPESQQRLATRPTDSIDAYDLYLRGRDYLRRPKSVANFDNAADLFRQALRLDPNYALAMAGLCEAHLARYELTRSTDTVDAAEQTCRDALVLDESLAEVHVALGRLYRLTGEFDKAERELRVAIEMDEKSVYARENLAQTLVGQNRLDEALLHLEQVLELQPGYWGGYSELGKFHYRLGHDDEALPYFRQVTVLAPDFAIGWSNLGAAYYMLGNFDGAAASWQKASDISPSQGIYMNLGTMYYYLGRYEDAVEMQKKAIELAPEDYGPWGGLAAAYEQLPGHGAEAEIAYQRAIEHCESILEVNPKNVDVIKNVALFYAETEVNDKALAYIEQALELAPEDPDVHFYAAMTHLTLGEHEKAFLELEQAVELGYSAKLIEAEPTLDPLKHTDRFRLLLADARS